MNEADAPECVVSRWVEQDPVGYTPHLLSNVLWRRFRDVQASSITLFFKYELLVDMQGFDADFGLHSWYGAGEETDLMFRVLANERRVAYLPNAIVHHPAPKSIKQPFIKAFAQSRGRARGTGALYAKHKLESWVIVRGLFSPWFYALSNMFNSAMAGAELGKAIGQLEGFSRWLLARSDCFSRHF